MRVKVPKGHDKTEPKTIWSGTKLDARQCARRVSAMDGAHQNAPETQPFGLIRHFLASLAP